MKAQQISIAWHPELSIYASEPFLKAVSNEYGWLGGIDDSGGLRCILPYTIIQKGPIRMVRFRVETIAVNGKFDITEEKEFLNSAISHFRSVGADMIIPATTNAIFRTYPDGAIAAPYGTYIVDLTLPEDKLWGNISTSHRRKVRLAMKQGVQIKNGLDHLDTAYTFIRDTFKRSRMGFMAYSSFRDYIVGLGNNVEVFVADHEGVIQGAIVVPYSNHCAYYVYGGSLLQPISGAMNLLHWNAIRRFRDIGVKRYDFVGVRINPDARSKQEGLLMFKQRFGGQLVQGFMWKYALRPMRSVVYSLAVRILRGGDIVDREHHKLNSTQGVIAL